MDKELFLARLRLYIEENEGITTAGLAVRAGLANSTIRRWFEGRAAPTFASAKKVLDIIGVSYEDFMADPEALDDGILDLWRQLTPRERHYLLVSAKALIAVRRKEH